MIHSFKSSRASRTSGIPHKRRSRKRQPRPQPGRPQSNWDHVPEEFSAKLPPAYKTESRGLPVSSHHENGGPVEWERLTLLQTSLQGDEPDDKTWEQLVMSQGEDECVRSQSPSAASTTSSASQVSETWDYYGQPVRTDTLETQAPTVCDIQRCQIIGAPSFFAEVLQPCQQYESNAEREYQLSNRGESDSGNEDTPSESSDDEQSCSNEAEADMWLKSRFTEEDVQNIKAFWTWSTTHVNWIHHDKETNEIIEWPKDLV